MLTLEARHANAEGTGVVDLQELVRQALRMNPGRLIVGECRGLEVRELLMALNTGHSGGGGTIHANSAADVPARLAALGALAGMSPQAVALQAASALDVVIHVDRSASGRVVSEIGVISMQDGQLAVVPALRLGRPGSGDGHSHEIVGKEVLAGAAWQELSSRLGIDPAVIGKQ